MISYRMRLDLDRYAQTHVEDEPAQDDGGPSLAFAAICVIVSAAVSFAVVYWIVAAVAG